MKRMLIFLLILLLALAFFLRQAFSETDAAAHARTEIYEGVESEPGVIAWSPDGRRIAFAGKTLFIYDIESGERKKAEVTGPRFVRWADGNHIIAVCEDSGRKGLCVVDAGTLKIRREKLAIEPSAVFPLAGGRRLVLVTSEIGKMTFGTRVRSGFYIHDLKEGRTEKVFGSDYIFPARNPDRRLLEGWLHAGINRLDDTILLIEQVRPPAIRFVYSKVISVDYASGKTATMTGEGEGYKNAYVSGSWSPDGRRLALTDTDGLLEILGPGDSGMPKTVNVKGLYPSWNPAGSQIFTGGVVVDSDGKNSEKLLDDAFSSIAQWSPDGRRLAVASAGRLFLFEGFKPYFSGPDRPLDPKLSKSILLLKGLRAEGLVSDAEYGERYKKLLKEKGD